MWKTGRWCVAFGVLAVGILQAGEVAAPTVAKIIKIVATSGASVNSLDPEISAELSKLGVKLDPGAKVVWALTDKDVSKFAKLGHLVICGHVSQIPSGAAIAIVAEGGRPAIYVSSSNLATSKVSIPDAVLKVGKVVK